MVCDSVHVGVVCDSVGVVCVCDSVVTCRCGVSIRRRCTFTILATGGTYSED